MTSVPEMAGEEMRCGGCGAKVGAGVLRGALGELETGTNEFVVADWRAQEDAAVLKGPGGGLELQTVDYFRSFIKDPFLFGELAVEHALNDLWAKRARPVSALAIATLPHAAGHIQRQVLLELLSGAEKGLRPHGVALMGGHSSEGAELALGFCLTGHALDGKWVRKGGLQEGEVLILTKRLGTGVLLAAHARGESSSHWFWDVLDEMRRSHGSLMRAFAEWDVRACTDVSGFGFAGHAQEMATASRHSVEIWLSHLPRFAAAHPLVEKGIQSTLHEQNVQVLAGNHSLSRFDKIILCDPQTSGGLLFSVPEKQVPTVLSTLHSQGFTSAAAVGRVLESGTSLAFIGKSS